MNHQGADPHADQPLVQHGPPATEARLAVIFVHGRNADADNVLLLADDLGLSDVRYLAPQAAGRAWYPQSFLAPIDQNEPGLTSALNTIAALIDSLRRDGLPPERVVLMGFSQGACLALEFAARHARRYAAVIGLSGGLIGPPGTPRDYPGSLEQTPVFLGCSDVDAHIPVARVEESAEVFRRLHGVVDARIYPGMGHIVSDDEREAVRALLSVRR